jgi:hypothetical protein
MPAEMNVTNMNYFNAMDSFKARNQKFQTNVKVKPAEVITDSNIPVPNSVPEEGITEVENQQIESNNQPSVEEGNPPIEDSENQESTEAKRLQDTQRKLTEMAEKLKAYRKLTAPLETIIDYDDNGNPVKLDFSKVHQQQKQISNEPTEPTDQEWEEAQFDAKKMRDLNKRHSAFEAFHLRKQLKAEQDAERKTAKEKQAAEVFNQSLNASWEAAKTAYPDYGLVGTPFRLAAEALVKEKPHLVHLPDSDWIIANMVAVELGVQRKTPDKGNPPRKSNMMNLGQSNSSSKTNIENPNLIRFKESQKRFLPKP